jgi:ribosome-binding ATPase YchF (GTP1/OBG family)
LLLKNFSLITLKPIIYAANVNEEDAIVGTNKYVELVRNFAHEEGSGVITLCAKLESELAELEVDEKKNFMEKQKFLQVNHTSLKLCLQTVEKAKQFNGLQITSDFRKKKLWPSVIA